MKLKYIDGYWIVEDPPTGVIGLSSKQACSVEPISDGWWLILHIAIWSIQDRKSVAILTDPNDFPDLLNRAIRPFDDQRDMIRDFPGITEDSVSPVFSLSKDGIVISFIKALIQPIQRHHLLTWINKNMVTTKG
jgi:hypothetical protein